MRPRPRCLKTFYCTVTLAILKPGRRLVRASSKSAGDTSNLNLPMPTLNKNYAPETMRNLGNRIDESSILGEDNPMAVVYNPNATPSIPQRVLPAHWDFVASKRGDDEYMLDQCTGRLNANS